MWAVHRLYEAQPPFHCVAVMAHPRWDARINLGYARGVRTSESVP